ncbi:MAG: TlpA disulfide reductase family protein [Candidatus Thiodiazotropha sp.]
MTGYRLPSIWLFCLICCLAIGCSRSQKPLQIGESIPDISLPDVEGRRMAMPSSLRGKVVLIHFWADWCPSCLKELEGSKRLVERYRSEGLVILAINLKQSPQEIADWVERLALNYPVLFDRDGRLAGRFGVTGLPTGYLIDRQGRLRQRILGEMQPTQWEQLVEKML